MRQTVICWQEDWEIVPFSPIIRDATCGSITVAIEDGVELWWIVQGIMMTVTWSVNPDTSTSGASTYTRTLFLERGLFDGALQEWALQYPWFELDYDYPDGVSAPTPDWYRAFFWSGLEEQGEDDVMQSTTMSAAMSLFHGGYGEGMVAGEMSIAIKLRFEMAYDDGTEGTLFIHSVPMDDPDPFDGVYQADTTASLMGSTFPVTVGDTAAPPAGASTYHFGGVPPTIELTPALWFEYRRSNGAEPIYDFATGTQLRDPDTSDE